MRYIKKIYCDFDGTITKKDVVNTFFEKFASEKWLEYEQLWIDGKISSMENAIEQVKLIRSVTMKELDDYINNIEITDYFPEFVQYTKKNNIEFVILSDGFDLFIKKILEKYGFMDIPFFSNHIVYENNKFTIEFPFHNKKCDIGAGMCKCEKVKEKEFCYIGDGTSDLCVARKADILFATKNLKNYCEKNNVKYYPFNSFYDIIDILERLRKVKL